MHRRIPFSFLIFSSTRKRLWMGGIGLAVFIAAAISANRLASPDRAVTGRLLGLDFTAFYTAGTFVREGRAEAMYDLDAIRSFQQALAAAHGLELNNGIGAWWNPPFYAWLFAPLSRMTYPDALRLWMGINTVCAMAAALLLSRVLVADVLRTWRLSGDSDDDAPEAITARPDTSWRTWALVPLLVAVSMPFIGVILHGQNGGTSLLLLTLIVMAWRADQSLLAGLLCGLLFYKPQLAAVVAGMLVLSLGIRAGLGLLCTGVGLLVLMLVTLPGSLGEFVTRMPLNLQRAQEALPYLWERHVTALAFWRLLIQGKAVGPTGGLAALLALQCGLLLGGGLVIAAVRSWKRHSRLDDLTLTDQRLLRQMRLDRLIAAALLAMPLIMPFYFDYDLILLAIPATLLAREAMLCRARGWTGSGQGTRGTGLWTALFVCLMINAPLGAAMRVNVAVPLLAALALGAIVRAQRPITIQRPAVPVTQATPVIVRRAA